MQVIVRARKGKKRQNYTRNLLQPCDVCVNARITFVAVTFLSRITFH